MCMHNLAAIHLIWLVCGLKLLFNGHSSLASPELKLKLKLMMMMVLWSVFFHLRWQNGIASPPLQKELTLECMRIQQGTDENGIGRASKLKRNIHQIYALRVAANECVGTYWCCKIVAWNTIKPASIAQYTTIHTMYSIETCVYCMANTTAKLLNQCRLFYLLQFSGLVIVICARSCIYILLRCVAYARTFTLVWKIYTAHSCFSDNRIGGFQFCCFVFFCRCYRRGRSRRFCCCSFSLNFWKQWRKRSRFDG